MNDADCLNIALKGYMQYSSGYDRNYNDRNVCKPIHVTAVLRVLPWISKWWIASCNIQYEKPV